MKALIGLGGNVGNVSETFQQGIDALNQCSGISLSERSAFYETTPVGSDAGDTYLNAAVSLECSLSAQELLDELQSIETKLGRQRTIRWGPRPLDLDLIGWGNEIIDTKRLQVPHPACWYRRFVLDPLVEIAPDWVHPVLQESVEQMRTKLLQRPLPVMLSLKMGAKQSVMDGLSEVMSQYPVTFGTPDNATVGFAIGSRSLTPRSIAIPEAGQPVETVKQILTAIFDEPKRVAINS